MKKLTILYLLISVSIVAKAQFSKLNRDLFLSQIHLVDEFIDRFNGNSVRPNLPEEMSNDRKSNILLLFDLAKFKSKSDTLFLKAEKFAERVIADSVQLHYEDTTWYAKALCRGMLQKKPVDFTLYLRVEKNNIGRYTWVIKRAEGKIFNLNSEKKHKPFTLMPDDHETNFMSLYRVTDETSDYIMDYMSINYVLDPTSVFLSWIRSGVLKIEYVKDLRFIFNQVPGFQFSIKYINRENLNAGWLIESFTEKDNDKEEAIQVVYMFGKRLQALSETMDFDTIRSLFSDNFRINDEIVRSRVAQKSMIELKQYNYDDYERCLYELIKLGHTFRIENIRKFAMETSEKTLSFFIADFIVEGKDTILNIKERIAVKNNKITQIKDLK